MKLTVNYNTIENMTVTVGKPLSERVIHVVAAFMQGYADAWVKYAGNATEETLRYSQGAKDVRAACKMEVLERFVKLGYDKSSEAYGFALQQLDSDVSWDVDIYMAQGLTHDDAFAKVLEKVGYVI